MKKIKFAVRFLPAVHAYTWRRTPADVDGPKWGVPCMVLGTKWISEKRKLVTGSSRWLWVEFEDGTKALRHNDNTFVSNFKHKGPQPTILKALKTAAPGGEWWQSARGTLERPATIYECIRFATPVIGVLGVVRAPEVPSPGWTLVDGYARVGELKADGSGGMSETDEEKKTRSELAKRQRTERALESARVNVKRYERRQKLATTLLAKWGRKLRHYQKQLGLGAHEESE